MGILAFTTLTLIHLNETVTLKNGHNTYARSYNSIITGFMEMKNFKVGPNGSVNVEKVMEWIKNYIKSPNTTKKCEKK